MALDGMMPELRTHLGEPIPSVRQFSTPLEDATTNSLSAFEAYVEGDEERLQGDNVAAIPLFRRAVELDTNFAMAYAKLGAAYSMPWAC